MSTHWVNAHYPPLGDVAGECVIESYGYPSNGWDDPGAGVEWYLDALYNESGTIRWYMPNNDYQAVERVLDIMVQQLEPDDPDLDWLE